jgi:hypothetical protein
MKPIIDGLTTPERLPTELASAKPAAAAPPPRIAGGNTQNWEIVVITPIVPIVRATSAIAVE